MRAALLVLLAGLLVSAPLAAAQAENAGPAGPVPGAAEGAGGAELVGPVPWTADAGPDLAPGSETPSLALADLAGLLTEPARAQPVGPPNGPVFPNLAGLVPRFCIQGDPIGACFDSGLGGPRPHTLQDDESDDAPSGASGNASSATPLLEETERAQRADEPEAFGVEPATTPPSDPVPAPASSHGGVPSRSTPTSLQVAPAPTNSLSWELATAAVALPVSLLAKLASILVLRRRARDASPTMRDDVLRAIAAQPGIRHRELVRRIGRGNGTVEHHVRRLVAEGRVARLRLGASTAYALAGDLSAQEAGLRLALQGRTSRRLALDVAANPGSRLTDVALRVGVSLATAHYQAGKLVAAGILRDVAGAGGRRLEPTPAGQACLAAVTADGPAVAVPFGAPIGLRPAPSVA